jgi:hypothetical protein
MKRRGRYADHRKKTQAQHMRGLVKASAALWTPAGADPSPWNPHVVDEAELRRDLEAVLWDVINRFQAHVESRRDAGRAALLERIREHAPEHFAELERLYLQDPGTKAPGRPKAWPDHIVAYVATMLPKANKMPGFDRYLEDRADSKMERIRFLMKSQGVDTKRAEALKKAIERYESERTTE